MYLQARAGYRCATKSMKLKCININEVGLEVGGLCGTVQRVHASSSELQELYYTATLSLLVAE